MSRKRKSVMITAIGSIALIAMLVPVIVLASVPVSATNTSDLALVQAHIASYISGQFGAGGSEGEEGFLISADALNTRINSNGDTNILGEGDDAAAAPILNDNLSGQLTWIPGTSTRCLWNTGAGGSGEAANCFDTSALDTMKAKVDAHAAAGFSTDIVDYCVSGHTEAPTTGAFGYIAQTGGLASDASIPKVYGLKWGRNGWTNTVATYTNANPLAAGGAASVYIPPTSVAAATACDSTVSVYELMRCQAQWAIYNGTVNGMTGGNVGNGQSPAGTSPAQTLNAGQIVDIRTGSPATTVSAGMPAVNIPVNTLFGAGLVNVDSTLTGGATGVLVASRTPMMGGIVAEGLKMLDEPMATNGFLSGGLPKWNNTSDEKQVNDGMTRVPLGSTAIDTTAPVITSAPAASAIGATSATISRTADEPATMKVEYGTTTLVYTTTVNDTVLNAAKSVALPGLTPSTPYFVKVTSYDGQANGTVSSEITFTTTAAPSTNDRYYYLPWYDSTTAAGMRSWISLSNLSGSTISDVEINVGGVTKETVSISAGSNLELQYLDENSGPAFVRIPNGLVTLERLTVSERTLYQDSFNENLAYDKADAASSYAFSYYDNNAPAGMMGDWIAIINVDTTDAIVDVYINDMVTPVGTITVTPGTMQNFLMTPPPYTTNGPVKVVARDGKTIITSQRVIYKTSFNEILGDKLY